MVEVIEDKKVNLSDLPTTMTEKHNPPSEEILIQRQTMLDIINSNILEENGMVYLFYFILFLFLFLVHIYDVKILRNCTSMMS